MSQSLNTAAIGMRTQQSKIDTIANNIANVNTAGYKKSRIDLKDSTYSQLNVREEATNNNLLVGSGAIIAGQTKFMEQGTIVPTEINTDLAISGDGFFALENLNGEIEYTRHGALKTMRVEGVNYLVDSTGNFVLDRNGNRIKVNFPTEQIMINSLGEISDGENDSIAQIALYNFENAAGLNQIGSNKYSPSLSSGLPLLAPQQEQNIINGHLEMSNVDLTEEMTQLMQAQRAYTFLSRAITTTDNMKSIENDIRR